MLPTPTLAKTHVIITGGAGFIGGALSAGLLAEGATVTILTRHPQAPRAAALARAGATVLPWDVVHGETTSALEDLAPAAVLVHLAADVGMTSPMLRRTNVTGTRHVLALVERLKIPYVLAASSIEAQGLGTEAEIPLAEDGQARPVSEYGETKLAAEQVVREWAAVRADRGACVVRIGNIYGPGSAWLLRPSLLALIGATPLAPVYWDLAHRQIQPLYIDDLVEALVRTAARRVTGLFNLPGSKPVSIAHYFEALAGLTGLERPLAGIQTARPNGAAVTGIDPDFGYLLLGTTERCHRVYDDREARRAIGPYARVDLRRGLAATLAWFHECGALGQLLAAVRHREGAVPCT